MSRVRDKADFQFAGEDYTHGSGVKYVANMIQTTDLDASGTTALSPELTLNLNNVYNFIRIDDGHAFYLSSNSEPSSSFTVGTDNITIDGSSIANIGESLTLSFSSSATPENTTLYIYCTVHPNIMKGSF